MTNKQENQIIKQNRFNNFYKPIRNFDAFQNSYSFKDILIFFLLAFIIPFLWIVIIKMAYPSYTVNSNPANLSKSASTIMKITGILFNAILPIGASIYLFVKDKNYFVESGLWIFTAYYFVDNLFSLFTASILSLFTDSVLSGQVNMFVVNFLIRGALIGVYFWRTKNNPFRIYEVNWKSITKTIGTILIMILVYYLISFGTTWLTWLWSKGEPSNQEGLKNLAQSKFGIASLFFVAVITSPIIEELCFRKVIFDIVLESDSCNSKKGIGWLPYVISIFYFSYLHISLHAELEKILLYMPLAIINGMVYWYFKNYYYCISIHFIINLISFIFMVSQTTIPMPF